MTPNSLIGELESALSSGSSEKHVDMLRRITGLFLNETDHLNEQQIGVFDDILVHLIQRIETKALVQLGTSLAPINNAPIEVIRHLSHHDEIEVAGPVLTQSSRLSEKDLIEVARSKGQGHLLAMSQRASLPETVTDEPFPLWEMPSVFPNVPRLKFTFCEEVIPSNLKVRVVLL